MEELDHCRELMAEHDAIAPTRRAARRAAHQAARQPACSVPVAVPAAAALPGLVLQVVLAGWLPATPREVVTGAALVGRPVLFSWPDKGWVQGRVARVSRTPGFSLVIQYGQQLALGSVEVVSLVDLASHGQTGRWVLLLRQR